MRAVGYYHPRPIDHPEALVDLELPDPVAGGRDLLVEVRAVSVNPVDAKVRSSAQPVRGEARVLGWDAAGIVRETGPDVEMFGPGDEVYYAGTLDRPGSNAELQLVDERLVGLKPRSLDFAEAAALPLTSITAWELLFDRLGLEREESSTVILIVGAAGGVGSILTQIAARRTTATVVGTASRPETAEWVQSLGAHHVVDHSRPLKPQLADLDLPGIGVIASLTGTEHRFTELIDILQPQGRIGLIDDPGRLDVVPLKQKSGALHWEFMFTRPLFGTADMAAQHDLLTQVSEMIDAGDLRTTVGEHLGLIDAENLLRAHAVLESRRAKGKLVLEDFGGS